MKEIVYEGLIFATICRIVLKLLAAKIHKCMVYTTVTHVGNNIQILCHLLYHLLQYNFIGQKKNCVIQEPNKFDC